MARANTIDASAFTLGSVYLNGLGNDDLLTGGSKADKIKGGHGSDILTGGLDKDVLTGGEGQDTFVYNSLNDSLLNGIDIITDYQGSGANPTTPDQIDIPSVFASLNLTSSIGEADSLIETAIQAILTATSFGADSAVAFTVTGESGTFIGLNDGVAGFTAGTDSIIQLKDYTIGALNPVVLI